MVDYAKKAPGNYIEELSSGEVAIQGTATSIVGFVGVTEKGRFGDYLVTSWAKFVEEYGSYINDSYLAYAVKGFFDNGGQYARISRVVHYNTGSPTSAKAAANITTGESTVVGTVGALSHGQYGNQLSYKIESWDAVTKTFTFVVLQNGAVVETYSKVSLATLEDVIENNSKYVSVVIVDESANLANASVQLTGGSNGTAGLTSSDYVGDESNRIGVHAFTNVAVNLIVVPGVTDEAVIKGVEAFTEKKIAYPIFDMPSGKTPNSALEFFNSLGYVGDRGAAYYPSWGYVSDPIGVGSSPRKLVPLSGHIAGAFARTDDSRGVFKVAAGEEDGQILGVLDIEYHMDDNEQGPLNEAGLNALRVFPGVGIVVWGARNASGGYISVRRSADYVEQSLIEGTRWTAFEPNDSALYRKITSSVSIFLRSFWRAGGLKGETEDEAFTVLCDSTTTTDEDVAAGRTYCEVGIATQKPNEFTIFRVRVK